MTQNLKGIQIKVHDMSLRDGMHPKRHQITIEQMQTIAKGHDEAGCPLIDVTHGPALGGASVHYGFGAANDGQCHSAVLPRKKHTKVSARPSLKPDVEGKGESVSVELGGDGIG